MQLDTLGSMKDVKIGKNEDLVLDKIKYRNI